MQKFILVSFLLLWNQIALGFETKANQAILIDYNTKEIIFEKEAHTQMPPSSMSKMMTAYVAFEALKSGQITLDEEFRTSEKSWRMEGTRMFIPLHSRVKFEDLLRGLIIHSGNDAAVSIAEMIGGSEEEFVSLMNEAAEKLGMNNTHFANATGLPDKDNYSTAYDLAILAERTISDFPQYYPYYAETRFTYNKIQQGNKNGLLYRNIGADGLKTGYTDKAGFGLTGSIKKGNRRLIVVVNGLKSNHDRTNEAESLISYGLANFINITIARKDQVIEAVKVSNGDKKTVEMITTKDAIFTLAKKDLKTLKAKIRYNSSVIAPIKEGDTMGQIIIETNIGTKTYPLVAKSSVSKSNFIGRIGNNLSSFFD